MSRSLVRDLCAVTRRAVGSTSSAHIGWIVSGLSAAALVACGGGRMGGGPDAAAADGGVIDAHPLDAPRCADDDGDGHAALACGGDDCDDADPLRHPGNAELCDSVDQDCDVTTLGPDADGDGADAPACCDSSSGLMRCGTDCDDTTRDVGPLVREACNGVDDDCDGMIDNTHCSPCDPSCAWSCTGSECDDASEISTGTGPACARTASGSVHCWGFGDGLGDGAAVARTWPAPVSGLTDATGISAGYAHACARRASGTAVCWGYNVYGQLGDGTTADATTPVAVSGLADIAEISAGTFTPARWSRPAPSSAGEAIDKDSSATARRTPGAVLWAIRTARSRPFRSPG
jgi:hypothetical protein